MKRVWSPTSSATRPGVTRPRVTLHLHHGAANHRYLRRTSKRTREHKLSRCARSSIRCGTTDLVGVQPYLGLQKPVSISRQHAKQGSQGGFSSPSEGLCTCLVNAQRVLPRCCGSQLLVLALLTASDTDALKLRSWLDERQPRR